MNQSNRIIKKKKKKNQKLRFYQFQIPTLKGSDFLKEQGPKFSIRHCANLEIVSTFVSPIHFSLNSKILFDLLFSGKRFTSRQMTRPKQATNTQTQQPSSSATCTEMGRFFVFNHLPGSFRFSKDEMKQRESHSLTLRRMSGFLFFF